MSDPTQHDDPAAAAAGTDQPSSAPAGGDDAAPSHDRAGVDGTLWLREAEGAIRDQLLGGARSLGESSTVQKWHLGDQYESLRPGDGLPEAQERTELALLDVQNARVDERLRMLEESRRTELEERLRLFAREETVLHAEQHRIARAAQVMRRRARAQLAKEVDAARWLEQQKFDADKRFIIDHEREKLVRRRRAYEARVQATTLPSQQYGNLSPQRIEASSTASPHRGYMDAAADVAPAIGTQGENNVVLVMTVDIDDKGRQDVITVRERDDYRELARRFVAQHPELQESVVEPLAREIAKNVANPPPSPMQQDDMPFHPSIGATTQRLSQQRAADPVFDRLSRQR